MQVSTKAFEAQVCEILMKTMLKVFKHQPNISNHHKFTGKSGIIHDTQISAETIFDGKSHLFIVAIKLHHGRVGINELLELEAIIDDIGAKKGVFISSDGFDNSLFQIAPLHKVGLISLRRAICLAEEAHNQKNTAAYTLQQLKDRVLPFPDSSDGPWWVHSKDVENHLAFQMELIHKNTKLMLNLI